MELAWNWIQSQSSSLITLLAIIGLYLLWRHVENSASEIKRTTATIDSLGQKLLSEKNDPSVSFSFLSDIKDIVAEIREDLEDHNVEAHNHYTDVKRLSDEEPWKHCSIEKCPHLPKILDKIERVIEKFNQFDIDAERSRQATRTTLTQLDSHVGKVHTEFNNLARTIIDVLKGQQDEKKKKGQ